MKLRHFLGENVAKVSSSRKASALSCYSPSCDLESTRRTCSQIGVCGQLTDGITSASAANLTWAEWRKP
ncbi:hypothetical protein PI126_g10451 [Phytophthora idaei]|nr:hypothetical protein PI126_g10451 [Phytophthora idaei]